jgi:hypothetical protein
VHFMLICADPGVTREYIALLGGFTGSISLFIRMSGR